MLILGDTIAQAQNPFSICLVAAAVTIFRSIGLANVTATKTAQMIANFSNLNAVIFGEKLDHDVSSSLYQQFDFF